MPFRLIKGMFAPPTLYFNDYLGDHVNAYAKGPSVLRKMVWGAANGPKGQSSTRP